MTTDSPSRDWLTADEAAEFLGITKAAVTKAARKGRFLGAYKAARTWHIGRREVERYAVTRERRKTE